MLLIIQLSYNFLTQVDPLEIENKPVVETKWIVPEGVDTKLYNENIKKVRSQRFVVDLWVYIFPKFDD